MEKVSQRLNVQRLNSQRLNVQRLNSHGMEGMDILSVSSGLGLARMERAGMKDEGSGKKECQEGEEGWLTLEVMLLWCELSLNETLQVREATHHEDGQGHEHDKENPVAFEGLPVFDEED